MRWIDNDGDGIIDPNEPDSDGDGAADCIDVAVMDWTTMEMVR